jgi:hypothetical protein
MLKIILIVIVLLIAAVLAFAATRPGSFSVKRSTSIKAPPRKIAGLIDDFHNWGAWSPWEKLDPAMQKTYSGAAEGRGAIYEWTGNSKVGAGRMEILEASPARTTIKLDFLKPFETHNIADFTLEPAGEATNVTWAMHGPSPYVMRVMGLFFNMDKAIGKDFETGLANLKAIAEK